MMQFLIEKCEPVDISWLQDLFRMHGLGVFPEVETVPQDYNGYVLRWDTRGLSLYAAGDGQAAPTRVDFLAGALRHRLATAGKRQGLLKAAGLDKVREPLRVLDATAGLGIDAFSLAARGCRVTLLEKSPVMGALLADGFRRAEESGDEAIREILARMTLHVADAHDWLAGLPDSGKPDVIYLDPMFPPRQKSARVKKDMALMQHLLPPNDDIDALLAAARELARKRVVLKRPGKASRNGEPKADFQVPGKACHFQVFLTG